jgi:alkylation response protein AidB-like acyl-CoA dehydrogenase
MDMSETSPAARRGAATLARVRALGELIERRARETEQASEIPREVVDALQQAGVFGLMVPEALGGEEAHPELLIDVLREIAYRDGSTGWYVGAVMTAGAVTGAFLGDSAVAAIFGGGGVQLAAGQAAPLGKAEKVAGGYRIQGRFSFGSGLPTARWVVGGYLLEQDDGAPVHLIALAPRSGVEVLGNWNVLGLRGTGSYDFHVREQVVPEDFVLTPAAAEVRRGGALYRMGFMALPCLTHAAFAVGCARRALDEWRAFAKRKARGPDLLAQAQATFQRDFAMAHAELRAVEAYARRTFSALYDAAAAGAIPEDLKLDGRLCASQALKVAAHVAQAAYAACTTAALRDGSVLQRCFRDLQAANAHVMTGEQSWIEAGRVLAGVPGAVAIF